MRKIGSDKEMEKKKKRNLLIISSFMLGIMLIGTVAFGFMSQRDINTNQNAQGNIRQVGDQWEVIHNGAVYQMRNSPEEVSNISVSDQIKLSDYYNQNVYIASQNLAIIPEIGQVIQRYASRVQEACYGPCDKNLPEKNCTDTLIVWIDAPENRVYKNNKCVMIEGDFRAVDAFVYKIIGY